MENYADTENKCDLRDCDNFCVDTKYVDEEKVEYEIIFGNDNIVFIKAGAGGNVRGYKNKYFQMAKRVHERIGATVICASNPDVPHVNFDEQEIRWVALERGFESVNLFLWGTSDGAYQNLSLAKRFPETAKWIGVNSSFITFDDFEEKLQDLPSVKKILVYGTEDDEYDVVFPVLMTKEDKNLKMLFIEGADHRFSDMLPQFIQTIDLVYEKEMDMEEDKMNKEFIINNGCLEKYVGEGDNVTIPDGVTRIGEGAFDGRVQLKELHIPNSVSCIEKNAFDERCNLAIFAPIDSCAKEYAQQNGIDFIFE